MNAGLRFAAIFLGGAALGALGAMATGKKLDFRAMRPIAADILSRGIEAKDAIMTKAETLREDMEDLGHEARWLAEQRRSGQAAQEEKKRETDNNPVG